MRKILYAMIGLVITFLLGLQVNAAGAITYQQSLIQIFNFSATTGNAISGAQFTLYTAEDIKDATGVVAIKKDTVIQHAVTNESGASFNLNLPVGKVYVKQTMAPEGYVLSDAKMYFTITTGCTNYSECLFSPVDGKTFNFQTAVSTNVVVNSTYSVEVLALGNASGAEVDNFVFIDDLPCNTKLYSIETGTYNEATWPISVYYRTNLSSDWKLFGSTTGGINKTLFANDVKLRNNKEVITSVYMNFGKVPIGFTSVTNPKISARVTSTPQTKEIVNKAVLSGYYNGVKVILPSYAKTTLTTTENVLSQKLDTEQGNDGYVVIVADEAGLEDEIQKRAEADTNDKILQSGEKPKTGDETPIILYVLIILSGIIILGSCIFVVQLRKNRKDIKK